MSSSTPPAYSRAFLRALHEQPMAAARARHVSGAVEFVKAQVLTAALAGHTERDFSLIVDAMPTADEVLEAIGSCSKVAPAATLLGGGFAPHHGGFSFGAAEPAETWEASGKLDPKSGLLLAASTASGKTELRFATQCMPDIVAALRLVFTDADIAFVKAAPASGGKDILCVKWD